MEKGTAAPMIAALLYQELRKAAADRAAPGLGDAYDFAMAPAAIERLLRERPAGLVPGLRQAVDSIARTSDSERRKDPRVESFALGLRIS